MKLSIIIPFGLSKERDFIAKRVIEKANTLKSDDETEFIFIEGYSSLQNLDLIKLIQAKGHRYFKDEKQQAFSLGECRNLGVLKAQSDCVLFLDVDCAVSSKDLEKILVLISLRKMAENINEFLVLPCFYLNEKIEKILDKKNIEELKILAQNDFFSGKKEFVKNYAICSSILVMNRLKFLSLGGVSKAYKGHGYEDFDFLLRLICSACEIEKLPKNLAYDARAWDFKSFEGFRALFALFGYETSFYGIYALHFHHPTPNQNGYMSNKDANHKLFFKQIELFSKGELNPYLKALNKETIKAKKRKITLDFIGYKPFLCGLSNQHSNLFSSLKIKLSQAKFYRLFIKFKNSPKMFFKDFLKKHF